MSVRLLSQYTLKDIQLDSYKKYELYIKGQYVETIRAKTIEEADTKAHQLHPYMTDDDYEIKPKNYYNWVVNVR